MLSARLTSRYALLGFFGLCLTGAACGDDDAIANDRDAAQPDNAGAGSKDAGVSSDGGSSSGASTCVPRPAENPRQRCTTDRDNTDPSMPRCDEWVKVEPPGATCSDGSQYKFFVNYAESSDNVVFMFEPGGACWDYASCSGGARGAANPHGIADDHMAERQYLNLLRRTDDNPASSFNMVFVPYCTGDVHVGDHVATYESDEDGGVPLTFRHVGLSNTLSVIDSLKESFPDVPQLLVTGCSAGGLGALQAYAFVRDGFSGTQCGYLLDDSGPAFEGGGPSQKIQDVAREAWHLDTYLDRVAPILDVTKDALIANYGLLNTALAKHYPGDRFSFSAYRMDFNYSLYLYERFYPDATPTEIHEMFWTEMDSLLDSFKGHDNLAYYVPYFRHDNCSHCVSIPPLGHDTVTILTTPWLGSEIASENTDLKAFTVTLLDNSKPLVSYLEAPRSDADFTSEELQECLSP